jgi:hypothetical protein
VLTTARTPRPALGARLGWRLVFAGATAAGIAAVAALSPLLVGPGVQQAGNAPPAPDAGPTAPLNASQVLELAAQHAALPHAAPRPDQFVYLDNVWVVAGRGAASGPGSGTGPLTTRHLREWRSVDGRRDGLTIEEGKPPVMEPGCPSSGRVPLEEGSTTMVACVREPAIDPALPTDPDRVREFLYRNGAADHERAWGEVMEIMKAGSSPVAAAAFRAAKQIPGVRVVQDAADVTGRHGVGLTRASAGEAGLLLIFDHQDYAYLGHRIERAGNLIRGRAFLEVGVTDRAGEQP